MLYVPKSCQKTCLKLRVHKRENCAKKLSIRLSLIELIMSYGLTAGLEQMRKIRQLYKRKEFLPLILLPKNHVVEPVATCDNSGICVMFRNAPKTF